MQTRSQFLKISGLAVAGLCTDWLTTPLFAASPPAHSVVKGETLSSIARSYNVTLASLRSVNGIRGDLIKVGQKLAIPSKALKTASEKSFEYLVQRGDNLTKIARQYGLEAKDIRAYNNLKNNTIRVGQKLRIQKRSSERPIKTYRFITTIKPKIDVSNFNRARWKHIIVHHSGTPTGSGKIFDYYHRHVRHMENGLAYHFVIGNGSDSPDGGIEIAERWRRQIHGGHVKTEWYNQNSIGICLVGNFEKQRLTRKQSACLIELIDYLKNDKCIGKPKLLLHREIEKTLCPGKYFPDDGIHKLFG